MHVYFIEHAIKLTNNNIKMYVQVQCCTTMYIDSMLKMNRER